MWYYFPKYSNFQIEQEVERNVLSTKVQLSDGTSGYVFTRNPQRNEAKMFTYNCHICSVPNLPGERCLYTHMSGRRHQTKLTLKPFDANLFRAPLQRSNKSMFYIQFHTYTQLNYFSGFKKQRNKFLLLTMNCDDWCMRWLRGIENAWKICHSSLKLCENVL